MRGTLDDGLVVGGEGRFIPACAGNTQSAARRSAPPAVHPRVCGEHKSSEKGNHAATGSSPRVRGTRPLSEASASCTRFIPACAGNTVRRRSRRRRMPVHPRVCGEHTAQRTMSRVCGGSSPRVRGTHTPEVAGSIPARFIPACAGNTPMPKSCSRPSTVHPRVCGEHRPHPGADRGQTGSSPRVRGTQAKAIYATKSIRFIPACAGNT